MSKQGNDEFRAGIRVAHDVPGKGLYIADPLPRRSATAAPISLLSLRLVERAANIE